jgi:hypothetical protein
VLPIAEATWRTDTTVDDNRRRSSSSSSSRSSSEGGSRRRKSILRIPKRASAKATSLRGMARANKGAASGGNTRKCRVQRKRRRESGKKYYGTSTFNKLYAIRSTVYVILTSIGESRLQSVQSISFKTMRPAAVVRQPRLSALGHKT